MSAEYELQRIITVAEIVGMQSGSNPLLILMHGWNKKMLCLKQKLASVS